MKFLNNMKYHCAFCFKELYGDEECICMKSEEERHMNTEIDISVIRIKQAYKNNYGIFEDKAKIEAFKNKNQKYYPPRR